MATKSSDSRRRVLAGLLAGSVVAAAPRYARASVKKPIREFGRVLDYLKNTVMRETEQEPGHIEIADAEFSGEDFINATWRYFRFTRCHFPASHAIQLEEMEGCWFDKCTFGPSRHDDTINFGRLIASHNRFTGCSFTRANVGFTRGLAYFERCIFENPDEDPNRGYFLSGPELILRSCKVRNYALIAGKKLHVMQSEFFPSPKDSGPLMSGAGPANKNEPIAEFIFESTKFRNTEKILWNTWIKSLTLSRVEVEGKFSTWQGWIKDTLILDGITKGYYFVGRTGTEKKSSCGTAVSAKSTRKTAIFLIVLQTMLLKYWLRTSSALLRVPATSPGLGMEQRLLLQIFGRNLLAIKLS